MCEHLTIVPFQPPLPILMPPSDRTKRVKDARSEAQKEIEDYRSQKEEEFKSFEKQVHWTPFEACAGPV